MICIRLPPPTGSNSIVWARAERTPSTQEKGVIGVIRNGSEAHDTIKFSYTGTLLRGSNDDLTMQLRCYNVKLIHVMHLFSLIHRHSTTYHAASFNCWWFAAGSSPVLCTRACHSFCFSTVGIGVLRHLEPNGDWTKRPTKEWVRSAVKTIGSNTKNVTDMVTREFLDHWRVREKVDLTDVAMWEVPHIQRVQTGGSC